MWGFCGGFFPFFFPFLLNSVDILCGGLVNISLETVKYLCKFQRSQFEINESCSARTMTNLFHLPAQQEEAAIPTEREPRAGFSVPQVSKGLWGIQQNLPFWRARFIDPPYPQNNLQEIFFNQKKEGMDNVVWGLYFQDQMTEFLLLHVRNIALCCNEQPS